MSDIEIAKGDEFVVVGTDQENIEILKEKRILIVDDEPDILETLIDLLDMCYIDAAADFEQAAKFLNKNVYDVAILDIMGVNGFELLKLTNQKGIPAVMLTAHALNPDALAESIRKGADSYVPKDKMAEIDTYVAEVIYARKKGIKKNRNWFDRLRPYFDKKFGPNWQDKEDVFWRDFNQNYTATSSELQNTL